MNGTGVPLDLDISSGPFYPYYTQAAYSNLPNKRLGRFLMLRFLSTGSIIGFGLFIHFSGVYKSSKLFIRQGHPGDRLLDFRRQTWQVNDENKILAG